MAHDWNEVGDTGFAFCGSMLISFVLAAELGLAKLMYEFGEETRLVCLSSRRNPSVPGLCTKTVMLG